MNDIIWLHDAGLEHTALVGAKAARLGELTRRRFHVPPAFCVTAQACDSLRPASHDLRDGILAACAWLAEESPAGPVFAVRSSSPAEDLATTSFAGQYNTFLNVALPDVPARVADCCASAASRRALAYRQEHGLAWQSPQMAVLVQVMIPCQVAGVAFSRDPLTGEKSIVIEAAAGLGEQVVGGTTTPHRYTILPDSPLPDGDDLLSDSTLRQLADLVPAIEQTLGGPQDVEWGLWQNTLYVLQARPITVLPAGDDVFSEPSEPGVIWTSGFFDERFPQPVSPLGWSVLKDIVEQHAFRETLQFLGTPGCEHWRLTRLYNGHPYTNMQVFQTIYKIFPDALLPEDASRFFIDRDAGLRRKVPYPRGLFDPRFLMAMLRHFLRDPRNWSPLHNWRLWQDFTAEYDAGLDRARKRLESAQSADLLSIAGDIQTLNGRLLAIHRWSLTDAEIFYSLLRRLLRSWASSRDGDALAAVLTSGAGNLSLETNAALADLRSMVAADPNLAPALGNREQLRQTDSGQRFLAALHSFLERFGHRSPSLDVYHPPFADDPSLFNGLLRAQSETLGSTPHNGRSEAEQRLRTSLMQHLIERVLPLRWLAVRWVLGMARHYLLLRENQRFYWQKGLARLRRIYLRLGSDLAAQSILVREDDVFFLTVAEVERLVHAAPPSPLPSGDEVRALVSTRRRIFDRLTKEWAAAPSLSYPLFLRGDEPLIPTNEAGSTLRGQPVSPGIARGPACVLFDTRHSASVPDGCILVVPSADPAWTPLFSRVAGVVLEVGGQLSHAAVVAREYGLPAVAGISGITSTIQSGEMLTVDGSSGIVIRQSAEQSA